MPSGKESLFKSYGDCLWPSSHGKRTGANRGTIFNQGDYIIYADNFGHL
jgi:hypothetical protein